MGSSTQPPLSSEQGREVQTSVGKCHSRKISIGILPDSSLQSRARHKDFIIQTKRTPTQSKTISNKGGKQLENIEAPQHEVSPWISTRSFRQKLSVAEHPPGTAEPMNPAMQKDNRVHSSMDGTAVGIKKISFATMRSMSEENVEHPNSVGETKGSETLRMKLWEILGTIAPSNNEHGLDVETENMSPLQSMNEEHVPAVHLRQNSYRLNMEAKTMSSLQNSDEEMIPIAKPRKNTYCLHMEAEKKSPAQNNDEVSVPSAKLRQNLHHLDMQAKNMMQVQNNNAGHVPAIKLRKNSYPPNKDAENMPAMGKSIEDHVPVAKPRQKSTCHKMQAKNKIALQNDAEEIVPIAMPRRNSHCLNMQAKNMTSSQSKDQVSVPVAKPIQNSDTIETDSECPPDVIDGRLRTHSVSRKKAAARLKADKIENATSTHPKKERKEVNNNSFLKERFCRRPRYAIRCGPKISTRKISERFSPDIRDQSLFSTDEENQPANGRNEGIPSHEKSQLQGDTSKGNDESKGVSIHPKRMALEIDSHMSAHLKKMVCCPKIQENASQATEKLDDCCLAFGVNLTKEKYVPDFPPINTREQTREASPETPKKVELGGADNGCSGKPLLSKNGIQSFKGFCSSRSNYVGSDPEQEHSLDDAGQIENSAHTRKSKPVIEKEPECRVSLSPSSSEDSDSHTSKEALWVKGFGKSRLIFPEVPTGGKSDFVHLNKKHFFEETVKASELLSSLLSEKVLEEDCNCQPQSDLNEEDELPSVISLFALALERVKSKMKTMVKKKSAEILMSVAEGIQFQLQTAQHQIQADMVKLTSINKLKRKRVDMRFEELRGQLKVIHARFKEEVDRHLQDCRSTVESLEAHQLELKATVEKQSVSHKKLLLQAEEAVETQLNDAQKRITEVHDLARKKMSQLKHDVADCF